MTPINGEKLVVLVPCLNEQENVANAVHNVLELSEELPLDVEIVTIDDGSTDDTPAVLKDLAANHDAVRVITNEVNLGIGRSVLNALNELEPEDWVTVFPGDNEFDVNSIREFVEVRGSKDIILGYIQNPVIRPLKRRIASLAFTKTTGFIYGFEVRYLNGLNMYRARVFQGIEVESSGHAYVAELHAKAILRDPHLRIGEAPFVLLGRRTGESSAVQPRAILQAVVEVMKGKRSIDEFRGRVVAEHGE